MAKKDDFYLNHGKGGYFGGRTLIQASGKIGGHRSVFVNLVGSGKNALTYPPFGGILLNPFKGRSKIFAGDFFEYNPGITDTTNGPSVKILKYYELAKAVETTDKSIKIVRSGYRHIPFIGDNIMVAPDTFEGKGTGHTIVSVAEGVEENIDVWELTLGDEFGVTAKKGDVLVEAAKAGTNTLAMVTNPNAYADSDADFFYEPNITIADDAYGALYMYTPALANGDTILQTNKINKLPPAVLAMNKSLVPGWFHL